MNSGAGIRRQPWKKRLCFYGVSWSHSALYGLEWSKGGFGKSRDCLAVIAVLWSAQNVPAGIGDSFLGGFRAPALRRAAGRSPRQPGGPSPLGWLLLLPFNRRPLGSVDRRRSNKLFLYLCYYYGCYQRPGRSSQVSQFDFMVIFSKW